MLELFWSRLSGLLYFLATSCWIQNATTLSQIVSYWPYFWPASSGVATTWGVVHGSLHGSLAIDSLVHLAVTQPPLDTLARDIGRVLAGHLICLRSNQCGGRLFITSSSHRGSACGWEHHSAPCTEWVIVSCSSSAGFGQLYPLCYCYFMCV